MQCVYTFFRVQSVVLEFSLASPFHVSDPFMLVFAITSNVEKQRSK